MYTSIDLKFAAGAKSAEALLLDLSRYELNVQPKRKVNSRNLYDLSGVARCYLLHALQQQNVPTSHVSDMFGRIDQTALDDAVTRFEDGLLDKLLVVFLSFTPDESFTGIVLDPAELPEILLTFGHFLVVDLTDFLAAKLRGDV